MLGNPIVGTLSFAQGWSADVEFFDRGRVWSVGEETCVEHDCFDDVLVVEEFNVEEVNAHQLK
jgi:hypothetical protein